MHAAVGRNQLLPHIRSKCLWRPLQSEVHGLSPQLAITSHIILKLLKWCRNEAASRSYIKLKAHSGLSTVEFGPGLFVLIYHIPAIKCRSGEEAAWSFGNRCDSEEYLQRFRCASWFALWTPKSPLIRLFSIRKTIKYEYFGATLLTSPPVNAHLEISNIVLQGTYEASL